MKPILYEIRKTFDGLQDKPAITFSVPVALSDDSESDSDLDYHKAELVVVVFENDELEEIYGDESDSIHHLFNKCLIENGMFVDDIPEPFDRFSVAFDQESPKNHILYIKDNV